MAKEWESEGEKWYRWYFRFWFLFIINFFFVIHSLTSLSLLFPLFFFFSRPKNINLVRNISAAACHKKTGYYSFFLIWHLWIITFTDTREKRKKKENHSNWIYHKVLNAIPRNCWDEIICESIFELTKTTHFFFCLYLFLFLSVVFFSIWVWFMKNICVCVCHQISITK